MTITITCVNGHVEQGIATFTAPGSDKQAFFDAFKSATMSETPPPGREVGCQACNDPVVSVELS